MTTAALAIAIRDTLRENLDNFYENDDAPTQTRLRAANCRVMPNHFPAPDCSDEFIAIYGTKHSPRNTWIHTAIEEEFGLAVAVTRRINLVPRDRRGEVGYISDPDVYAASWKDIAARCREIIGLLDKSYALLREAETHFNHENGFSEPLYWSGADAAPTEVGAEHFCAYHTALNQRGDNFDLEGLGGIPEVDDTYGLLMHLRFDGAIRLQARGEFDTASP